MHAEWSLFETVFCQGFSQGRLEHDVGKDYFWRWGQHKDWGVQHLQPLQEKLVFCPGGLNQVMQVADWDTTYGPFDPGGLWACFGSYILIMNDL